MQNINIWRSKQFQPPFYFESGHFDTRGLWVHSMNVVMSLNQVSVGSYDLFTGTIDGVNNMLVKNLECCFLRQIYWRSTSIRGCTSVQIKTWGRISWFLAKNREIRSQGIVLGRNTASNWRRSSVYLAMLDFRTSKLHFGRLRKLFYQVTQSAWSQLTIHNLKCFVNNSLGLYRVTSSAVFSHKWWWFVTVFHKLLSFSAKYGQNS